MRNYVQEFWNAYFYALEDMTLFEALRKFFDWIWQECVAPEQRNAAYWRERAEKAEAALGEIFVNVAKSCEKSGGGADGPKG